MDDWLQWIVIISVILFAILICILVFYSVRAAQPPVTPMTSSQKHQGKVVIAGLLRNGSKAIPRIKEEVTSMARSFDDYRIIIVENDSEDDTRKQLLQWVSQDYKVTVLGCGINASECKLGLPKTINHDGDCKRIAKMAYLRNIYLEYVKRYFNDYDYLIVLDYDLRGKLSGKGFKQSIESLHQDPKIDGICAFGRVDHGFACSYFDTLAQRELGEDPDFESQLSKVNSDIGLKLSLWGVCNGQDDHIDMEQVGSCFGGLAIYRISSLLRQDILYDYPKSAERIGCEHAYLNVKLNMYLNHQMVLEIHENPLA